LKTRAQIREGKPTRSSSTSDEDPSLRAPVATSVFPEATPKLNDAE